jgi:hypothetical protein
MGGMKRSDIASAVVRKLAYMGKWGASHTSFDNLPKGFPSHIRGDVKHVAEKLIKQHILLAKPTSYGREVSLNLDTTGFHLSLTGGVSGICCAQEPPAEY